MGRFFYELYLTQTLTHPDKVLLSDDEFYYNIALMIAIKGDFPIKERISWRIK
jgi:hypothetical protein